MIGWLNTVQSPAPGADPEIIVRRGALVAGSPVIPGHRLMGRSPLEALGIRNFRFSKRKMYVF